MSTDKPISGNKGEWSEFYTFCYLLRDGVLKSADSDLQAIDRIYLPIIRIIRGNKGSESSYYTDPDTDKVQYYIGVTHIEDIGKDDFEKVLDVIFQKFQTNGGEGAFAIPEVLPFMKKIGCSKLKADPLHKEDIRIQVHDVNTGQKPEQGFSIKSYIGSDPTLLNAGETTNFRFTIEGADDSLMETVNGIEGNKKIIRKMEAITPNHSLKYLSMNSKVFEKNLQIIDSQMPKIVAEMLRIHYETGIPRVSEVVGILEKTDPLGMENRGFYEYKVKSMLRSIALGMIPSEPWYGKEDANGGYIVVKEDGDVVCFFLYNRNEFEQYLFDCTKFERASTSRHNYMKVEKDADGYKINLNLQIRFVKPGRGFRKIIRGQKTLFE